MIIRTIGDYGAAASLHEIADNERAIAEGRIVLVKCPEGLCDIAAEDAPDHICYELIGQYEALRELQAQAEVPA